jgi:hypothetical protein
VGDSSVKGSTSDKFKGFDEIAHHFPDGYVSVNIEFGRQAHIVQDKVKFLCGAYASVDEIKYHEYDFIHIITLWVVKG